MPPRSKGRPNPNPPFDVFAADRFNYPYALRNALTGTTRVEHYRALFLENEYLKVTVLPELGGHLYSCLDKISGREMFYANKTIKKALIGYRGAWAAFGIEFNFPVSHNWMSMSPVSSVIVTNADGSTTESGSATSTPSSDPPGASSCACARPGQFSSSTRPWPTRAMRATAITGGPTPPCRSKTTRG